MILEWVWFGHSYGIGISLDWQNIWIHPLIYGLTVPVVAYIHHEAIRLRVLFWEERSLIAGLLASMTAALYLELLQMWQYHWTIVNGDHVGMGDPLDLLLSWGSAYLVYWITQK